MAGAHDYTAIGGMNIRFPPTEWTRVIEPAVGQAIQTELIVRYWKPIYCFLRTRGYSNEQAKDLTQGFFTEIILDSNLFKNLDRSKGKFRTLLLTALNHYIIDVARHEKRRKRHPGMMVSLDTELQVSDTSLAEPEQAFDYGWAAGVLENVLADLRTECVNGGLTTHWEVFQARVLTPILEESPPPALSDLCKRLGIATEATASNMIVTVKRRFKQLLRRYVRRFVDSDADVDSEIVRLAGVFACGVG